MHVVHPVVLPVIQTPLMFCTEGLVSVGQTAKCMLSNLLPAEVLSDRSADEVIQI